MARPVDIRVRPKDILNIPQDDANGPVGSRVHLRKSLMDHKSEQDVYRAPQACQWIERRSQSLKTISLRMPGWPRWLTRGLRSRPENEVEGQMPILEDQRVIT